MLLVLDDDIGDRLGVGFVYGFPDAYTGIEPVVDLHRADMDAVFAPVTLALDDVAGVFPDPDAEAPGLAVDRLDLGACVDGDVRVPAHIHHLWREDAHGAVVCGKRLIELSHMPADGGFALDEVHVDVVAGKVERRLDSGDPGADDDNLSHCDTPRRV